MINPGAESREQIAGSGKHDDATLSAGHLLVSLVIVESKGLS